MRHGRPLVHLWPGLADLWRGSWAGLAWAVAFGLVLNVALLATLLWTDLLSGSGRLAVWMCVALVCVLGNWHGWSRRRQTGGDLFSQAQTEYLRGNWLATQKLLEQRLRIDRHDAESLLLLAGVLRRTRRLDEAEKMLKRLERTEAGTLWEIEIAEERRQLAALEAERRITSTIVQRAA